MSMQIIEESDLILEKYPTPDRATFFQLKHFVIGKEPTVQSQIWACIRNIEDRRSQIDVLELEIDNAEDDLKLLDIQIEKLEKVSELESEIHCRKLNRQKQALSKNTEKLKNKIKYVLEELQYFLRAFKHLTEISGGVKDWDDIQMQKEYWNGKLREELNLSLLLNKPVSNELVQTILSLDDDMPVKKEMVTILENVQKITAQKQASQLRNLKDD